MSHEPYQSVYQSISCAQYDLYEIAIMRGQMIDLEWCDEQGAVQQARVKPVGLQTREGQEFLLLLRNVQQPDLIESVRLDRVRHMK